MMPGIIARRFLVASTWQILPAADTPHGQLCGPRRRQARRLV